MAVPFYPHAAEVLGPLRMRTRREGLELVRASWG